MRLTRLSIQNFRAIANLTIEDLTDAVVLAGPNGCGKSCVLDAIRLLKSAYGSYEQDEWQTWFGEFQIDLNREPRDLIDLFQEPTLPLQIAGTFTLSNEERTFLSDNAISLLEAKLWRELNPHSPANSRHALGLGATQRATNGWIEENVFKILPEIRNALDASKYEASLGIEPFGNPDRSPNQLLELIFSTYEPQTLGIIDYHGPNRNSSLLIDEPELHLNPRLVSGLASFYYRQLGSRLDNQLWLVTHSDTLIREAVSHPSYSVFHIHPAGTTTGSQATAVKAQQELERVVIALVGDLAAYRPNAKVVIFEGGGDTAFDVRMTCTLFPEFERRINPIAAGNKKRVGDLYHLLSSAHAAGHLPARFYAITDSDNETSDGPGQTFQWDVYHIENYLLEPRFLLGALRAIGAFGRSVRT